MLSQAQETRAKVGAVSGTLSSDAFKKVLEIAKQAQAESGERLARLDITA
jgi:hypothetical protein